MKLTVLGSGTSTGVPVITCKCRVCRSRDPKNHRTRASVWIESNAKSILIDSSSDFRSQALAAKIPRIDAVLYTHPHADHIMGIDDLRAYNFAQRETIPLYGNDWTCQELRSRFQYIFNPGRVEGGGIPRLSLNRIKKGQSDFRVGRNRIRPLEIKHGTRDCLGFRIDSIAYITDCSYIPPKTRQRMRGLEVLVLDCVRIKPHSTHLNLDQALEVVEDLRPKRTFLTHLGHDFDYKVWNKKLPRTVSLAYDGLKVRV